jgi:hypothetical protein
MASLAMLGEIQRVNAAAQRAAVPPSKVEQSPDLVNASFERLSVLGTGQHDQLFETDWRVSRSLSICRR